MADKIEILENTITKLLIRRGTENERQAVTLDLGEPGFTTDTKRLFIGDGTTPGGVVAGNKFFGTFNTPIVATTALTGDCVYATRNGINQYYTAFVKTTETNTLSSWTPVVPIASTPKAWVCFDGSSTVQNLSTTMWSSYNVRNVDVTAQGLFTVVFSNVFSSSGYAVSISSSGRGNSCTIDTDTPGTDSSTINTKKINELKLRNTTGNGTLTGSKMVSVFLYTTNELL